MQPTEIGPCCGFRAWPQAGDPGDTSGLPQLHPRSWRVEVIICIPLDPTKLTIIQEHNTCQCCRLLNLWRIIFLIVEIMLYTISVLTKF